MALAALAYFSKETALVLPLLGTSAVWARSPQRRLSLGALVAPVLPHMVVAAAYLAARFAVLRGLGGTNDPVAPWWGRGLQVAGGLVHAVTAYAPVPDAVAWLVGGSLLVLAGVFAVRASRVGSPPASPALRVAHHRGRDGEAEREGASVASGCGGEGAGPEVPEGGSERGGGGGWGAEGRSEPFEGSHINKLMHGLGLLPDYRLETHLVAWAPAI